MSHVPLEVTRVLPSLIESSALDDTDKLRALLFADGLLDRHTARYLGAMAIYVSAAMASQALSTPAVAGDPEPTLLPLAHKIASSMPVVIEDKDLDDCYQRLTLALPPIAVRTAADLDLRLLCCLLSVAGAAAKRAGWDARDIQSICRQMTARFEDTMHLL